MTLAIAGWFPWCVYTPSTPPLQGNELVVSLYKEGLTPRRICLRTGLPRSTVYGALIGQPGRTKQVRQLRKPSGYMDAMGSKILELLEFGIPKRVVARQLGLPFGSLRGWLERHEKE